MTEQESFVGGGGGGGVQAHPQLFYGGGSFPKVQSIVYSNLKVRGGPKLFQCVCVCVGGGGGRGVLCLFL